MTTEPDSRLDDFPLADAVSAQDWLDNRDGAVPEPLKRRGGGTALRIRAALTRSANPSGIFEAGLGTSTALSANTAQRPNPRRPM